MRYLAESNLTYRRLPALGIGLGAGIAPFWSEQFPGLQTSAAAAGHALASGAALAVPAASCCLVYADLGGFEDAHLPALLTELARVLRKDGVLLLRAPDARRRNLGPMLASFSAGAGWLEGGWWRRSSVALRFDTAPMRVFGSPACVSL
jgi:hypothetical protein